jgi:5-oxoprolinase (ATP-hydrolysing) subunit C
MTLTIVRALGLVTLQDLGRPGHMHEALPPGGALVRGALIAANRLAGNPDGAAAIEILGTLTVRAESPLLVATADAARLLRAGDQLALSSEPRRAAYLALAGGIDAPLVLGGHGAHLSAGLGRLLRAGDRLSPASPSPPAPAVSPSAPAPAVSSSAPAPAGSSSAPAPAVSPIAPVPPGSPVGPPLALSPPIIRVIAGPDLDAFAPTALAALTSAPYRILPTSDRVGTRLAGPLLPRRADHPEQSRPMVRGALEVPRDGAPIVLGPEHPTTGGYPIIAVIAHADLDRFFSVRLGGEVRFAIA